MTESDRTNSSSFPIDRKPGTEQPGESVPREDLKISNADTTTVIKSGDYGSVAIANNNSNAQYYIRFKEGVTFQDLTIREGVQVAFYTAINTEALTIENGSKPQFGGAVHCAGQLEIEDNAEPRFTKKSYYGSLKTAKTIDKSLLKNLHPTDNGWAGSVVKVFTQINDYFENRNSKKPNR